MRECEDYDEIYRARDGETVVMRIGACVRYERGGETVAEYALANGDLANKKFNQLKRLFSTVPVERGR